MKPLCVGNSATACLDTALKGLFQGNHSGQVIT